MTTYRVTTGRNAYFPEYDERCPTDLVIPAEAEYVQTDYDIEALANYIGRPKFRDITGAFVVVGDGDYDRIFVTWDNKPYSIDCAYFEVTIHLH